MKISDVRVRLVQKDDSKMKAVASITIEDCFVVHDIKIIEGKEGYFIAMPSRKASDGEYKDIVHPINTETRKQIIDLVLEAFEAEKNKPSEE
ncbi:MAG: septation regulator SpoVG [Clostridia bacterium]|nr:septation regulator SpoVG [Clostridia bacterium]